MAFKAGAITGDAILDTSQWDRGVKRVGSSSKSLTGTLGRLAKIGFVAVAAGMTAAIYQANKYQKEFRNVSTLTDQNTKDLQEMSLGLLRLDSQLGSTTQLTRSMYDAISAGAKPGKQAFQVIESSAKFAKAAMADNAASVRLLSATVNAYGKDAKTMAGNQLDAEAAADIFFKTIKLGVVTGEQLSSSIGDSIPLFASMKIPVEQLAAGMAAMTKQGVNAAQSTTQLNAIINAFLKPSSALTEVLKEQGYESGQAFIQSEGLAGALELLKTTTESGKFEMAELTRNIRAIKGVLALSGEGARIFNETLEEMENAGGAVNTAFQKQEKTFATFRNEVGKTAIIVGNIGKHFVDDIAGGAQAALESLNQFLLSEEALKKFAKVASKVGGAFAVIKTFAMEVYNLFAENLYNSIEEIKETFNDLFDISVKQGTVFDALSIATNVLGGAFSILISILKLVIKYNMNLISIGIDTAKTFKSVWDVITGKAQWEDVKDNLLNIKDGFAKFGTDLVDDTINVVNRTKEQWDKFTNTGKETSKKFADSMKEGSEKVKKYILENGKAALSGVKNNDEETIDSAKKTNEIMSGLAKRRQDSLNLITKGGLKKNKTEWDRWLDYVEANLDTLEKKIEFFSEATMKLINTMYSGLSNISDLYYKNEFDKLELSTNEELSTLKNTYETDLANLTSRYEQGLITESEYNESSKALEKKYESDRTTIEKDALKERNALAKKQFENNKALALASVWIDAASAIMGFWAAYAAIPFAGQIIAGTLTSAVLGVAGVQSALIAEQQFVPEYAEGTAYHSGGLAMINEEGGEILDLPTGTRVIPHDLSEQMVENGNGIEININNPIVREDNDINRIVNAVSQVLGRQLRTA
jgi:TP901 family phage tail tape measure protein